MKLMKTRSMGVSSVTLGGLEEMKSGVSKKGRAVCAMSSPTPGQDWKNELLRVNKLAYAEEEDLKEEGGRTYIGSDVSKCQILLRTFLNFPLALRHFPQPARIPGVDEPTRIQLSLAAFKHCALRAGTPAIQRGDDLVCNARSDIWQEEEGVREGERCELVVPVERSLQHVKAALSRVDDDEIRNGRARVVDGECDWGGLGFVRVLEVVRYA